MASSVLADYAYRLRKDSYLCTKYEVCGHLIVSVVSKFSFMMCNLFRIYLQAHSITELGWFIGLPSRGGGGA